jgi:2-dehydro-3-deoxy-D-arabinonate dehydratase
VGYKAPYAGPMSGHLKLFRTRAGWVLETEKRRFALPSAPEGALTTREDLPEYLTALTGGEVPGDRSSPSGLPASGLPASGLPASGLPASGLPASGLPAMPPLEQQEVWAAGVTYFRSRTARMEESKAASGSSFYDLVYSAERPELFFKAAPWRVVGSDDTVRIRRDAQWSVPEPELVLLISPKGRILGYTAGNDMSSRDIEGENPLYLPQAKVYDGSCALGPALVVGADPIAPGTRIEIEIRRGAATEFTGSTSVSEMKRDFPTLVEYLYRETSFPHGCLLFTGTGIVPPDGFTLQAGDEILVTVGLAGTLRNIVG